MELLNHEGREEREEAMHRGKSTLLANRHQFNLLSLGHLGESRAGTRDAGRRAERGISLPVAGAPTLGW